MPISSFLFSEFSVIFHHLRPSQSADAAFGRSFISAPFSFEQTLLSVFYRHLLWTARSLELWHVTFAVGAGVGAALKVTVGISLSVVYGQAL
jgi:hypothetical protein